MDNLTTFWLWVAILLAVALVLAVMALARQRTQIYLLTEGRDDLRSERDVLKMGQLVDRMTISEMSCALIKLRAAARAANPPQTPQKATPRFTEAMAKEVVRQMQLLAPDRLPGLRYEISDYGCALCLTVEEDGCRWVHRFRFDNGVEDTSLIDAYRALGEEKFLSAIAGAAAEALARYIDNYR